MKAPESMMFNGLDEYVEKENTVCTKCGPTSLIFEGFI